MLNQLLSKDVTECFLILTKLGVQLIIINLLLAFQEKLFQPNPTNNKKLCSSWALWATNKMLTQIIISFINMMWWIHEIHAYELQVETIIIIISSVQMILADVVAT